VKGHSGMIYRPSDHVQMSLLFEDERLVLERVPKSNPLFVKWYIEHYPQSKGIVGRQLNYIIHYDQLPIGIIAAASPPRNYRKFRDFFQADNDLGFLNNNVYRIVNKPDDKNIGTKILKTFRLRVLRDYGERYGTKLLGLVTFVEPPRTGAIYKADNWNCLGLTQGISVSRRGKDWMEKQYLKGERKHIFAYMYTKKALRSALDQVNVETEQPVKPSSNCPEGISLDRIDVR
jgi:hypothetical protein